MDILDSDQLNQSKSNNQKRDLLEFTPLGIIAVLFIYSSIKVITTDYLFSLENIIGFSFAFVSAILFFLHRKSYKILLGLLLIAGTFNLVAFNLNFSFLRLTIGITVNIQFLSLALFILYFIIFRDEISSFLELIRNLFREEELSDAQKEIKRLEHIKFYKRNLADKTSESLQLIIDDKSRVKEARIAAEELLKER